ncbi:related to sterigmatocystin 7-O-methyltransferase precursor [Phialocephala subalpina]|uniref:Related to sterigmatocystin 7-O-methyltransferase n=1 Tax=Phialocephala subalpina TaxID=576137 RepID=A0A1L7XDH1_9HELO|nr:related to sterigmatocystin 7-O-methyltransferase precursor [Phialocephala subalpina]
MKLRVTGKRWSTSLGSWSVPFVRSASPSFSQLSRRAFSSTPARRQDTKRSTSQLIELAGIITRETEKLDKYLKDNGSPQPSFDVDGPANFPKLDEDMKKAREEVVRATKELGDLVAGPTESIRWMAWDHNNSLSLHAIYHYKIAQSFPINETTTFTQIAEKTGLDEINVRRFMRHAMTNRIFKEVEPGVVAHTAASRVLAEDKAMQDWVGFCVEDIWPAASRVVDAINLNPSASEPTQAGFQLANNTVDVEPMFVTFGKSPLRAKRMGGAMTSLTGGEGYEVSYLINNYDWATINAKSGTVVDIGGSHGFVCIDLAKQYPNLKFIVQDLPKTVQSAPKLEGDLGQRVKFQVHDFHTEQKVKGADVYLYRWIFHNHSDPYAINLLRKLVPALKRGARVVINDHCLPEPNTESLWDERIIRSMDLVMLTLLNARERSEGEFRELFERASEGFEGGFRFLGSRRPEGCRMSIVEAVWEGEDFGGVSGE